MPQQSNTSATKTYRLLSALASTNGANIKSGLGTVTRVSGYNAKATPVYLKLYDKATAPTVGTDTPRKTRYLPASSAFDFHMDDYFGAGIGIALTGAAADADTTALLAGDILALNVDYR